MQNKKELNNSVKDGLKRCSKCKEYKSFEEFHKLKGKSHGCRANCKLCVTEESKIKYKNYTKEELEILKKKKQEFYQKNKDRILEQKLLYRETAWKKEVQKRYGITIEEYEEMVKIQDNKCAICGKEETAKRVKSDNETKKLSIDHCHETGIVRKLLCTNCNHMLGNARDIPEVLRKAAEYLESFKN